MIGSELEIFEKSWFLPSNFCTYPNSLISLAENAKVQTENWNGAGNGTGITLRLGMGLGLGIELGMGLGMEITRQKSTFFKKFKLWPYHRIIWVILSLIYSRSFFDLTLLLRVSINKSAFQAPFHYFFFHGSPIQCPKGLSSKFGVHWSIPKKVMRPKFSNFDSL